MLIDVNPFRECSQNAERLGDALYISTNRKLRNTLVCIVLIMKRVNNSMMTCENASGPTLQARGELFLRGITPYTTIMIAINMAICIRTDHAQAYLPIVLNYERCVQSSEVG